MMAIRSSLTAAVTYESLEDWDMLTWSLGWTGFFDPISPPIISIARLLITSLTFILVWVPDPVWKTTNGNSSIPSLPEITSSAAFRMWSATFGSRPYVSLIVAAAFLRTPNALMRGWGIRSATPPTSLAIANSVAADECAVKLPWQICRHTAYDRGTRTNQFWSFPSTFQSEHPNNVLQEPQEVQMYPSQF